MRGAIIIGSDVIGGMGSKVASALRGPFTFLIRLAWESRIRLPVLITVAFMVLDIRMQLEINVNLAVRRIPMIVVEPDVFDDDSSEENTHYEDDDDDDEDDDESSECSTSATDGTASIPLDTDEHIGTSGVENDSAKIKVTEDAQDIPDVVPQNTETAEIIATTSKTS